MSVAIIGGNECMERRYIDLCKQYKCKAKVFTKPKGMSNRIGKPDMVVFFTNTMSHKMINMAMTALGGDTKIVRSHSSSLASLKDILNEHAV